MPMELVSKQFALSGRLKPEARLGLAISEFSQTLDSERREEFRLMQNNQAAQISGGDIIKMTEQINQEGARRHRAWRPHGTKVGGFLSRIQSFATIGDVLVGGSQNLIATGIWSAVRLSLTIATNYLSYFEKLSTLFMRLGTSWTLHEDFARLFPGSETLQAYFCEYLIVLMRLCNKVVTFCQKKTTPQVFSSLGSSFDSEFGPVQKELDQWGCLIQQQTQLLATKAASDSHKGRFHDLRQRLLCRLSPHQTDFETRWRRQRKKGTCEWLFDTSSFKTWNAMQTSATISVSGKLGSGKTVTLANMVARINLDQPCAYVFCSSQETTSLKANHILGSIAFSLIGNLPTEATARRIVKQDDIQEVFEPDFITDLLLRLLPEDRKYIIIADGLEDCPNDDINDVLCSVRRLMRSRTVLFCYSNRSNSRFQQVAEQQLTPEFSISHDNSTHEEELEAYIVAEVTRRNAARHLCPELEALVKEQLIAGAQGMYLWVSLQLDSIFPSDSKAVITDDQVLNLITNLPKDLPEALEQALERIVDQTYEGKIMKLIMSAVNPLGLDEIRVALCVAVGEPVWHPGRLAKHGSQLISLCGGNLLDLDEEDAKVRFIHHSVIQHLLSPATSGKTTPYHFTVEEAENYMGATCVTYLNLPVLDSRITGTRNFQSHDMLDGVIGTTHGSMPGFSHVIEHIKSRKTRRARPSQIDIGHVLSQIQATRTQEAVDPRCFLPYATSNWLSHTRFFDDRTLDCKQCWPLWWRLVNGGVATVKPPCEDFKQKPYSALLWAVENAHGSLFRNILAGRGLLQRQIAELMRTLELHKTIHGHWLGDILAQYLQSLRTADMPFAADKVKFLLDSGADPTALHSILKSSPIEILIHKLCSEQWPEEDEKRVIRYFFSHPVFSMRYFFHSGAFKFADTTIENCRKRLLESGKSAAIAELLAVQHNFDEMEVAAHGSWEELWREAIDTAKVNVPTASGTSLLWEAIQQNADDWIYKMLRAGADPNVGPFAMKHDVGSPRVVVTCYPLEAALWLRMTRVCLTLLRHGADAGLFVGSLMQIAEKTENWIMIARLQELPEWVEWVGKGDCTALSTACKFLSHTGSTNPLGFPRALSKSDFSEDWRAEVHQIIYRLARDADATYLDTQDLDKKTALHYLSESNHTAAFTLKDPSLVKFLTIRGADPNLLDCDGNTPLWLAIRNSAPVDEVIEPLLMAGASPNKAYLSQSFSILRGTMTEYRGQKEDKVSLVRLLLRAGADPRDPLRSTCVDPILELLVKEAGMQSLINDLWEHADRLNGSRVYSVEIEPMAMDSSISSMSLSFESLILTEQV